MANRVFYFKSIGNNLELCLACGWTEPNTCNLFTRNTQTREIVDDFGTMNSKDAYQAYSATKGILKENE